MRRNEIMSFQRSQQMSTKQRGHEFQHDGLRVNILQEAGTVECFMSRKRSGVEEGSSKLQSITINISK